MACGTSARHEGSKSAITTTRSKRATRPKPAVHAADARTRARARRLARALNLQASDLPGFTVASEPERETLADKGIGQKFERCMGGQTSNEALAEASSRNFEHQAQIVHASASSSVRILATPEQASAELKALRGGHPRRCLTSFVRELLAGEAQDGASTKLVAFKGEVPLATGTSGTFAWSMAGQLTLHGVTAKFYIELAGFIYGRTKVELLSFAVPVAFPARDERDLFSLLVSRAKAGGARKRGKSVKPGPGPSAPRRVQISGVDYLDRSHRGSIS